MNLLTQRNSTRFNSHWGGIGYIGCFNIDSASYQLLSSSPSTNSSFTTIMTARFCSKHCFSRGLNYSATTQSYLCYCSNTLAASSPPLDMSRCRYPCPGNITEACGGPDAFLVYQTSLKTLGEAMLKRTSLSLRHLSRSPMLMLLLCSLALGFTIIGSVILWRLIYRRRSKLGSEGGNRTSSEKQWGEVLIPPTPGFHQLSEFDDSWQRRRFALSSTSSIPQIPTPLLISRSASPYDGGGGGGGLGSGDGVRPPFNRAQTSSFGNTIDDSQDYTPKLYFPLNYQPKPLK